ncbi:MAG: HYR domain-containing protein [Phycisphaerae bacterium]
MRSVIALGFAMVGVLSPLSLGADYSLVPAGSTTITVDQTVQVDVFVNNVTGADRLRAYQATLQIVPGVGTTGSLGLVDPITPDPNNTSIFVDNARPDWVFAAASSAFTAARPDLLRVAATLFDPVDSAQMTIAKYCGTYIFQPSAGALGDFQVDFLLTDPVNPQALPTFMLSAAGTSLPFTASGLTITVIPPALNDDCANAGPVGTGSTPFTTENRTTDGVDLSVACDEGNGVAINQDVWFEHTATCNGVLTISTCNDANFDTRLAVYGSGAAACTCPTDNTTLLACNDNAAGCAGGTSEVALSVSQGECLTIRLGGVGLAEGTGSLTIRCAPDLCADAEPIAVNSSSAGSTANTVVNDAIGPNCGSGVVDSPGVWYSLTGTGDLLTASLQTAVGFDSRLTVYEGGCAGLTCVAEADNPFTGQESVSWCSTLGTSYLVLVHGVGGAAGSFTLDLAGQSCDDGNACTDDSCNGNACVNTPNFDAATVCCVPSTGTLNPIDDLNPCTDDFCNPVTGVVAHPARPDGAEPLCDDLNPCTLDGCQAGACANTDINGFPCAIDSDCPGASTCAGNGFCTCAGVTFELMPDPGASAIPGCYAAGETFTVRVEMGPSSATTVTGDMIVGAQIFLAFDPTTLSVISVEPGSAVDGSSPFVQEFNEIIDPAAGTIDYVVGTSFFSPTQSPGTLALITFLARSECTGFLRFRQAGPLNLLSTIGGTPIEPILLGTDPISINAIAPVIAACPTSRTIGTDRGLFTAVSTWINPGATDNCDAGPVSVVCDPPSGTAFTIGTTTVTCTATDACGLQSSCSFDVTVETPVLTVDVELSATAAPGPFQRCITFDVWDCNAPGGPIQSEIKTTMAFTNGRATAVSLPIPGGPWTCLSARDELHTLRSTSADFSTIDGINYTATLTGARSSGGHWLLGGNLNDDDSIDILDFGVFFPKFLTQAVPDMPCGFSGPDANVNGDAVVDIRDLAFVAGNSLQVSEPACCAVAGPASSSPDPVRSISIRELRARGLIELVPADANQDGVLDEIDISAMLQSGGPAGGGPVGDLRGSKSPATRAPGVRGSSGD